MSNTNGVKQGGGLSPILFSVYMDRLFQKLESSGVGCYMRNHYAGAEGYADDLALATPTLTAMRILVGVCELYAADYDVKFNGTKSQFLFFRGRNCDPDDRSIIVNGIELQQVSKAIHLGHVISTDDKDSLVSDAIAKFWRSFNIFTADFSEVYSYIKCKLFKQYCCSFYGAPLWSLDSRKVNELCVAWRKAVRKIWRVPYMSHGDIIALLSECFTQ